MYLAHGKNKVLVVAIALLGMNIMMLCNSRGGFLGLIAVAIVVSVEAGR